MKNIFEISVEDVQIRAIEKFGRELTFEELYQVRRGIEFGLELAWEDVVYSAIEEVAEK